MPRLSHTLSLSLSTLVAVALLSSCRSKTPPNPKGSSAGVSEAAASAGLKPVYPPTPAQIPEGVGTLCEALHTLPNHRKATCCHTTPGVVLTDECIRNLSGAITQGGLKLDLALVSTCTTALGKTYEGCDWVGPHMPEVPMVCTSALKGLRKAGEVCHSALECEGNLRCAGAGPTDAGRCQAPAAVGKVCSTGTDALGAYLRIDAEALRPGCAEGFCDRNICRAGIARGEACQASVQCAPGLRCAGKQCIEGEKGSVNAPCTGGDCAEGLRCVGQVCSAPRAIGSPCSVHAQCQAGCVQQTCQQVCSVAQLLQQLPAANTPPKPVLKPELRLKLKSPEQLNKMNKRP